MVSWAKLLFLFVILQFWGALQARFHFPAIFVPAQPREGQWPIVRDFSVCVCVCVGGGGGGGGGIFTRLNRLGWVTSIVL